MGDSQKGELLPSIPQPLLDLNSYDPGKPFWIAHNARVTAEHAERLKQAEERKRKWEAKRLEEYGPDPICYSTGPDEIDPGNWHEYGQTDLRFAWVVYHYERGSYEGSGDAVARATDGTYWQKRLGHCSCYGPEDGSMGSPWEQLSIEQLLALLNPKSALDDLPDTLRLKLGQVMEMEANA